jgi:hypothetical protein
MCKCNWSIYIYIATFVTEIYYTVWKKHLQKNISYCVTLRWVKIGPCNIRKYSVYSDPSSSNTMAKGSDHSMLSASVLHKLLTEKILLCSHGHLHRPLPPSSLLKIYTFFNIKTLHSAWVADSADLYGSWEQVSAHVFLHILKLFRIWQFLSYAFSYFQPHIVKTTLVRGYCILSNIIQVILKPCTGYLLVDRTIHEYYKLTHIWSKNATLPSVGQLIQKITHCTAPSYTNVCAASEMTPIIPL